MTTMTFRDAIGNAMSIRMREDPNVIMLGQDVGFHGGTFGVSASMFKEFGPERVLDTPISEGVMVGAAVGAAATGIRPIVELQFADFITLGADQMANQAAKMRYMFGGKISVPMVLRLAFGAGVRAAAQHSQSLEAWMAHIPGLKIVMPSTPQDALGLMLAAIDDDNPVVFMENKLLYRIKGEITDEKPIPLGKGDIKRPGKDFTVIATGRMVHEALKAADILSAENIELEVLDPRSLYPLDTELIKKSLEKTNRAIIITEEYKRGSYGGAISALIAEEYFDLLSAPIARIGALNCPVPFSPPLEDHFLPCAADIIAAVKRFK